MRTFEHYASQLGQSRTTGLLEEWSTSQTFWANLSLCRDLRDARSSIPSLHLHSTSLLPRLYTIICRTCRYSIGGMELTSPKVYSLAKFWSANSCYSLIVDKLELSWGSKKWNFRSLTSILKLRILTIGYFTTYYTYLRQNYEGWSCQR